MSARRELLYLIRPVVLVDAGLMASVGVPEHTYEAALPDLERFLELLEQAYLVLGGQGLEITQLREARLNTPKIGLSAGTGEDLPIEQFLEVFRGWIALERER